VQGVIDNPMAIIEVHDGRQLAAARALAGLGIRDLAAAAGVTVRTLHRLETGGLIQVAEKKRHGCVQRDLWAQIVTALAGAGVELLPQGASFGAGVRWRAPRERRPADAK
jgi:DNA-binding XRE family transcriptional regulator